MPTGRWRIALLSLLSVAAGFYSYGQAAAPMPPDYRGFSVRIPGVFVTPVPNAPDQPEKSTSIGSMSGRSQESSALC